MSDAQRVGAAGLPDALFDATVADYYRTWLRYHPEAAVEVGVDGYSHMLTPFSEAARMELVSLNNALLAALGAVDRRTLTPARAMDYEILLGAASLENQYLLQVAPHRIDPGNLLPVNALFQLTQRNIPAFSQAFAERLYAVPAHLDLAHEYLLEHRARIPRLWRVAAIVTARSGAEYVQSLPRHPKVAAANIQNIEAVTQTASKALQEFARFIETLEGTDVDVGCGPEYFAAVLRLRHFLDLDSDTLYAFGEALYDETERDLKDAARALGGSVGDVAARMRTRLPARERLLSVYRDQMEAARAFVQQHDLVSLPVNERLTVMETPTFLRHQIPFAAYSDPAPNDPAQQGYYYVTPPRDASELAEHDLFGLMHTCVHEAWPGHHLQFVTANGYADARSLPRLLNASATFYEGWALYCEQLMHEQGFLAAPEQRFILLKDRLWRALRIMIDVDLHTRGLATDHAAQRLVERLGFPLSQAKAEITWYSKAPGVPLGYATGWALINATRDRLRATADFSLKEFHDRLLRHGSIALPLAIESAFGRDTWHAARSMVFV